MKKSKFTEEQILFALRQAVTGTQIADVTLIGGMDAGWNAITGCYSTIKGKLDVRSGRLTEIGVRVHS